GAWHLGTGPRQRDAQLRQPARRDRAARARFLSHADEVARRQGSGRGQRVTTYTRSARLEPGFTGDGAPHIELILEERAELLRRGALRLERGVLQTIAHIRTLHRGGQLTRQA